MKKSDQNGFITMILLLVIVLAIAVTFVFLRIKNAQG